MARLISNAALWGMHRAQGRADALCEWVRDNGLHPNEVAADYDIVIDDTPDGRMLRCHVFVRTDAGAKTVSHDGGPHVEERTVPLVVEPPDDWPVYAVPGTPQERP